MKLRITSKKNTKEYYFILYDKNGNESVTGYETTEIVHVNDVINIEEYSPLESCKYRVYSVSNDAVKAKEF